MISDTPGENRNPGILPEPHLARLHRTTGAGSALIACIPGFRDQGLGFIGFYALSKMLNMIKEAYLFTLTKKRCCHMTENSLELGLGFRVEG